MLTDNQVQRLARLVRLAPHMDREQLEGLSGLVRDLKAVEGAAVMPQSAIEDMAKAVPDKLVREVVSDLRGGRVEPGWLPPTKSPPIPRGTGWVKPLEHGSPSGQRYVDQMMDVQDALDKRDLERRLRGGG
jgi:hypothetical protein